MTKALIASGEGPVGEAHIKAAEDPLNLKKVTLDLTVDELLGLFKRFSIAISLRGLVITGREYTTN